MDSDRITGAGGVQLHVVEVGNARGTRLRLRWFRISKGL
jgi:hypothetical protein